MGVYRRGLALMEGKRYKDAEVLFTKTLALNPDLFDALLQRGVCYENLGRHQKSVDDLSAYLRQRPNDNGVYYTRAQSYLALKNYDSAVKDLSRSIAVNDKAWWVYNSRAKALMAMGLYSQAILDLNKVVQYSPGSRRSFLLRALCQSHNGAREGAVQDLERAIMLSLGGPIQLDNKQEFLNLEIERLKKEAKQVSDERSALRLGFCHLLRGEYAQADKFSNQAVGDEKIRPCAYVAMAYAKFFLNQIAGAFSDARTAATFRRYDYNFYFPLTNLYFRAGTTEKAVREYDALIKKDPKNPTLYLCRAEVLSLLHKDDKAIEDLSEAHKRNQVSTLILKRRAALYAANHQIENSLKDLTEAIALDSKDGELYSQRAKCLFDKGDYKKAEEDLSAAIALKYDLAKNYAARAACFRKLGRASAAAADLADARRARPLDFVLRIGKVNYGN